MSGKAAKRLRRIFRREKIKTAEQKYEIALDFKRYVNKLPILERVWIALRLIAGRF